jgi:HAD superfamily hydrolase (TIGR01509 family)
LSIRAVVFDLDGVLTDSTPCHRQAFEQTLAPLGIGDFDYAPYAGQRTGEVIEAELRRAGMQSTPSLVEELAARKTALARAMLREANPVRPGSPAILDALSRAGYPLALASSGSAGTVETFLEANRCRDRFCSILTGADVSRAKPDPEIYRRAAGELKLAPSECLVVEDAVAGVIAARRAGSPVLGITGTCPAAELLDAGAWLCVDELTAIPAVLAGMAAEPVAIDPQRWTAVIPAAGRGSRLGFSRPKILFPVAGRMIVEWILDFLGPVCSQFVFVLSPDGRADVESELEKLIPGRYRTVIQEVPIGMGDAVSLGLGAVDTRHAAVVWGDQVALRRESVAACLRAHDGWLQPDLTCPTVWRAEPYIHFERDVEGCITGVLQKREGDTMPAAGESDTGFFCCRVAPVRRMLAEMRANPASRGAATGEFNFLPVIAELARRGVVISPALMSEEETVGINSAADAAAIEAFLRGA